MTATFILQNQDSLFYGKSKEWVDGYDANAVYKTAHKDEAVNQMFEITSKDYKQRVKVLACDLNEKGLPIIDSAIMPAPLPKAPKKDLFADQEEAAALLDAESSEVDGSEIESSEIESSGTTKVAADESAADSEEETLGEHETSTDTIE